MMFKRHIITSLRLRQINSSKRNLSYSSLGPLGGPRATPPGQLGTPRTIFHDIPRISSLLSHSRRYTVSRASDGTDLRHKKLTGDPSKVTTTSSIRPLLEVSQAPDQNGQKDTLKEGFRHDLNIIRETFAFRDVPKEVILFGGAGLVPYIATTASTFFLAWDINNISQDGAGYLISQETASAALGLLEPIQVGFGAVILSFLGAIHWGLEFASYGGSHPYQRYLLGILAPALAWPTVFMQYDFALLTQFLGFTGMYFADSRATTLGLAPRWYTTYRFLLTFIVGACIVLTLIGRGRIDTKSSFSEASHERVHKLRRGEGLETTTVEYNHLIRQDQEEIQNKALLEKEKSQQDLAQKKAEYIEAKEAAKRAARKVTG